MFSWVVKVVPQPPEKAAKLEEEGKGNTQQTSELKASVKEKEVKKAANPEKTKDDGVSEDKSTQSGVLNWISQGLSSSLPQPSATPSRDKADSDVKQQEENSNSKVNEETGVINWIVQGLGKVVPQPDDKHKQQTESQEVTEVPKVVPEVKVEQTEVKEIKEVKVEPEPPPPVLVVEVVPDAEADEDKSITPRVMEWIKHGFEKVIPQPGHSIPSPTDASDKKDPVTDTAPPPAKAPEVLVAEETTKGTNVEEESNVVGWIVQGLGRIMPQPVVKPKEDTSDTVQSREKAMRAP